MKNCWGIKICLYLPFKYQNTFNKLCLNGFELYSRWVPLIYKVRHLFMKHLFSFAMDDMDEILLRVLDNTWLFLFWNNIDIGE